MVNNSDNNNASKSEGDFVDLHVNRMIDAIQIFLNPRYGNSAAEDEEEAAIKVSLATKKYAQLKIKIVQDSPRDAGKVREILRAREVEYEKAEDSEEIERLITEIDMLKFLLFLVNQQQLHEEQQQQKGKMK